MTPVIKTKIHNPLKADKIYNWIEGGIWVPSKGEITVDYDIYTKSLIEGKVKLLMADMADNRVVVTYLVNEQIKVDKMADESAKPVEIAAVPNLAIKAEEVAVKETNEKLPEMLQTKEQLEEHRKTQRFDLNEVIWKKDKALPKPMPEPINMTVERLKKEAEKTPMSPGRPSRPARTDNVVKV